MRQIDFVGTVLVAIMFRTAVNELKASNLTTRAFELAASEQRRQALRMIEHVEQYSAAIRELHILKASLALSYDLREEALAVLKYVDELIGRVDMQYSAADTRYLKAHVALLAQKANGGVANGFPVYGTDCEELLLEDVSEYLRYYLPLKEHPDWPQVGT